MMDLWARIGREVAASLGVVLYVEPGDLPLKGAFIECGMALALCKPVAVVAGDVPASDLGSWLAHPLVSRHATVADAVREIRG